MKCIRAWQFISVPGELARGGGGGSKALAGERGANTILAWPGLIHHPEGEGAGAARGLGCIHNAHLAHSIIKILIREILEQEDVSVYLSSVLLASHTRRVVTS